MCWTFEKVYNNDDITFFSCVLTLSLLCVCWGGKGGGSNEHCLLSFFFLF